MNNATYTISKTGTTTKVVSSTGEQFVFNNRIDYSLEKNSILVRTSYPDLRLNLANIIVTGQTFTTILEAFNYFFTNKFFSGNA